MKCLTLSKWNILTMLMNSNQNVSKFSFGRNLEVFLGNTFFFFF